MTENPWSLKSISSAIFVGIIVTVLGGLVLALILQSDRFDPTRNTQGAATVVTKVVTASPAATSAPFSILATNPASVATLPTAVEMLPPRLRLTSNAPLYQGPGKLYPTLSSLVTGEEVTVIARDAYRVWYYIQRDDGHAGWIERTSGHLLNQDEMSSIPEIRPDSVFLTVETNSNVATRFPEVPTSTASPRPTSTVVQIGGNFPVATPSSIWGTPTMPSGSQVPRTPLPTNPPNSTAVLELPSTSTPSFQPTAPALPVLVTESVPTSTPDIPPTADTP